MLDVGKLATLRAVVAHGSFSAAAHAIGLTQPAVSRQVSLLERRVGTQLVRRTQHGVFPTEAGRLLVGHAEAILDRLQLAEAQVAELAGLRAGHVRLGAFFTALVYLSAELTALLEERHPALFRAGSQVIEDALVDRAAALRGLAAAELDVAIVFEHAFAPDPAPPDVELVPALRRSPLRAPARHAPAGARARPSLPPTSSATPGSAPTTARPRGWSTTCSTAPRSGPRSCTPGTGTSRSRRRRSSPPAAASPWPTGSTSSSTPTQVTAVPMAGDAPVRHVQAAIMREQRAPAARAVLEALREVGRRRAAR